MLRGRRRRWLPREHADAGRRPILPAEPYAYVAQRLIAGWTGGDPTRRSRRERGNLSRQRLPVVATAATHDSAVAHAAGSRPRAQRHDASARRECVRGTDAGTHLAAAAAPHGRASRPCATTAR